MKNQSQPRPQNGICVPCCCWPSLHAQVCDKAHLNALDTVLWSRCMAHTVFDMLWKRSASPPRVFVSQSCVQRFHFCSSTHSFSTTAHLHFFQGSKGRGNLGNVSCNTPIQYLLDARNLFSLELLALTLCSYR